MEISGQLLLRHRCAMLLEGEHKCSEQSAEHMYIHLIPVWVSLARDPQLIEAIYGTVQELAKQTIIRAWQDKRRQGQVGSHHI